MCPQMSKAPWFGLAGTACVLAAAMVIVQIRSPQSGILTVDSMTITGADFEWYADVFEIEGRDRLLSDDYILLALVNQALVIREAERRGITISTDHLDAQMALAGTSPILAGVLATEAGREGYRTLLERKLRFDAMKQAVTGHLAPSAQAVAAYFEGHREDYPLLTIDDVSFEISTILRAAIVDKAWREWLAGKRACAAITVLDPRYGLPPETFEGQCAMELAT